MRKPNSLIRNRIAQILAFRGYSYGYEIYKLYKQIFGNINMRSIYYNLKKGIELGEFIMIDVKKTVGNYTWGEEANRVYYGLGPFAEINIEKEYIDKLKEIEKINIEVNWKKEIENILNEIKKEYDRIKNQDLTYWEIRKKVKNIIYKLEKLENWASKYAPSKIEDIRKMKLALTP